MELLERRERNVVVLAVSGKLDAVTVADFNSRMNTLFEAGEARFVVDMGGLHYISSAGLRGILTAVKKAEAKGGKLLLCGLSGLVRDAFRLSGYLNYFATYATVEEALAAE